MAAARVTAEVPSVVVFVLPDARRLGFQLRMNRGGAYLEQLRLAVTVVQERAEAEAGSISVPTTGAQ